MLRRQLPELFCPVPACDPELRVFPPGRVNLRNQNQKRMDKHLGPSRGHVEYPNGMFPQSLFSALARTSLAECLLPPPLPSSKVTRVGQDSPCGEGGQQRNLRPRWGSRAGPPTPGVPLPLPWPEPSYLLPDLGISLSTFIVSPCHLLPLLCKSVD